MKSDMLQLKPGNLCQSMMGRQNIPRTKIENHFHCSSSTHVSSFHMLSMWTNHIGPIAERSARYLQQEEAIRFKANSQNRFSGNTQFNVFSFPTCLRKGFSLLKGLFKHPFWWPHFMFKHLLLLFFTTLVRFSLFALFAFALRCFSLGLPFSMFPHFAHFKTLTDVALLSLSNLPAITYHVSDTLTQQAPDRLDQTAELSKPFPLQTAPSNCPCKQPNLAVSVT